MKKVKEHMKEKFLRGLISIEFNRDKDSAEDLKEAIRQMTNSSDKLPIGLNGFYRFHYHGFWTCSGLLKTNVAYNISDFFEEMNKIDLDYFRARFPNYAKLADLEVRRQCNGDKFYPSSGSFFSSGDGGFSWESSALGRPFWEAVVEHEIYKDAEDISDDQYMDTSKRFPYMKEFPVKISLGDFQEHTKEICEQWRIKLRDEYFNELLSEGTATVHKDMYKQMRAAASGRQGKVLDMLFCDSWFPNKLYFVRGSAVWTLKYASEKIGYFYNYQEKSGPATKFKNYKLAKGVKLPKS